VLSRSNPPRSAAANSFRFRSYVERPILHYFGANKSFRFRSYRLRPRNPFRMRSYENPGGVGVLPSRPLRTFRCAFRIPNALTGPSDLQTLDALLLPLCFHILTNCFSRKPFILITIRIARGCHPPTFRPSDLPTCQLFCLQRLANSFSLFALFFRTPIPLFSIVSSLFLQNTRGGVSPLPIQPNQKDKT